VQVKISVRHGHLSENTQAVIREKAEKLLHIFDRLTLIEVTIDLAKNHDDKKCGVEFVVQAEHKHDIVARESQQDIMAAIDLAVDKVQGQLRRYKEKIQAPRRTPSAGEAARAGRLEDVTEE
jgi:putative sigma-54 modulation protein